MKNQSILKEKNTLYIRRRNKDFSMNIGVNVGKEIIACAGTSKCLLATRPVKVNIKGIKCAPHLEKDTVNFSGTVDVVKAVEPKSLEDAIGIKPIKNSEEYNTVLQRLQQKEEWGDNSYGWYKNPLISWRNAKNYPTCRDIEKGVVAYAGYDDIHTALNSYLSGRRLPEGFSKQMGEDFTRLVDYSLKDMDKTFPPYNGVTYRLGFFDPKVKQYYSTSKSPETFPYGNKLGQHTMFVSKRGHDIEAFQKAKNKSDSRQTFIDEHEVLMDVSADYRELVNLTPELIEKRLEYAKIILMERKEPLTEDNIKKIISEIKVYEEI